MKDQQVDHMAPEFDQRSFRDAMGAYPTGVTVITALAAGRPIGITANSFASLSLDPPLVLWSPARQSARCAAFIAAERFTIHILAAGQRVLAQGFAESGDAPFAAADWAPGPEGVPELAGCAAVLRCVRHGTYPGGDHEIVVGRVAKLTHDPARAPLVFHRGDYPSLS
ncbi:MAG: flavin reductase family protein [Pseudomonadota bacterium]